MTNVALATGMPVGTCRRYCRRAPPDVVVTQTLPELSAPGLPIVVCSEQPGAAATDATRPATGNSNPIATTTRNATRRILELNRLTTVDPFIRCVGDQSTSPSPTRAC